MELLNKIYKYVPKKVASGTSMVFVASIICAFLGYGIRVGMAWTLTPADIGLFYSIFTVITCLFFIKDFGFGAAVAKHIAEFKVKKKYNEIKTIIFLMFLVQFIGSCIIAAGLFFGADWLAVHYFHHADAALMMKVMCFYIVFSITFKLYKAVFQGFQKIGLFSLIEPSKNLFAFLAVVFFCGSYGLWAPIIGYVVTGLIVALILFPFILRTFPFWKYKIVNVKPLFIKMLLFGLPVMVTAFGGEIIAFFDILVLTYFNPLTDVGIYSIVLPTSTIVLMFGRSIGVTIYPMVSEMVALNQKKKIVEGIKKMYKWSWLLVFPWIVAILLSKPFLWLFFGAEYVVGTLPLQILFTGSMFYIVGTINIYILAAAGRPNDNAKIILSAAVVNIILNLALIPFFGMVGAAIATTVSFFWALYYSKKLIRRWIADESGRSNRVSSKTKKKKSR